MTDWFKDLFGGPVGHRGEAPLIATLVWIVLSCALISKRLIEIRLELKHPDFRLLPGRQSWEVVRRVFWKRIKQTGWILCLLGFVLIGFAIVYCTVTTEIFLGPQTYLQHNGETITWSRVEISATERTLSILDAIAYVMGFPALAFAISFMLIPWCRDYWFLSFIGATGFTFLIYERIYHLMHRLIRFRMRDMIRFESQQNVYAQDGSLVSSSTAFTYEHIERVHYIDVGIVCVLLAFLVFQLGVKRRGLKWWRIDNP